MVGLTLAGLFAGAFVAVFPWWLSLILFIAPLVLAWSFIAPHYTLFLTIVLIFNAIPHRFVPKIPVGAGGLEIYDVLILLVVTGLIFRSFVRGESVQERLGAVFVPFIYACGCVLISVVYVKFYAPNHFVFAEARQHIGWLLLPIGALALDSESKYRWYIKTLLLTAVVVAAIVIFQSVTKINIIGGRLEELDRYNTDITRTSAGGTVYLIIFSLYLIVGAVMRRRLGWWIGLPLLLLLVASLLVTFGRAIWVATMVGLVIATYLNRGFAAVVVVLLVSILLGATAVVGVSIANPRLAQAVTERALGLSQEFRSGNSFYFRRSEALEALKVIPDKPLMGTGLGGAYKLVTTTGNSFDGETRYIHNAYILLPLKMGLHAALIPVFFIVAAVVLGRRAINCSRKDLLFVPAAAAGAFVVPIITSVTQPEWGVLAGIAPICCILLVLLLHGRFGRGTEISTRKEPDANIGFEQRMRGRSSHGA